MSHHIVNASKGFKAVLAAGVIASTLTGVPAQAEFKAGDIFTFPSNVPYVQALHSQDNQTPEQIALAWSAQIMKAETVLLANESIFTDSFASGGLQGKYNAPLLLTSKDHINNATLAEISRLGTRHVIIVGGLNAVGTNVLQTLEDSGLTYERLNGETRVETSIAIGKKLVDENKTVYLINGAGDPERAYADALSVGAISAKTRSAVLVNTSTEENPVHPEVLSFIKDNDVKKVIVVGGSKVVSPEVTRHLTRVTAVQRISGPTRVATSEKLAKTYPDTKGIVLIDGFQPPEIGWVNGIAASLPANKLSAPVLLAHNESASPNVTETIKEKTPKGLVAYTGTFIKSQHTAEVAQQVGGNVAQFVPPAKQQTDKAPATCKPGAFLEDGTCKTTVEEDEAAAKKPQSQPASKPKPVIEYEAFVETKAQELVPPKNSWLDVKMNLGKVRNKHTYTITLVRRKQVQPFPHDPNNLENFEVIPKEALVGLTFTDDSNNHTGKHETNTRFYDGNLNVDIQIHPKAYAQEIFARVDGGNHSVVSPPIVITTDEGKDKQPFGGMTAPSTVTDSADETTATAALSMAPAQADDQTSDAQNTDEQTSDGQNADGQGLDQGNTPVETAPPAVSVATSLGKIEFVDLEENYVKVGGKRYYFDAPGNVFVNNTAREDQSELMTFDQFKTALTVGDYLASADYHGKAYGVPTTFSFVDNLPGKVEISKKKLPFMDYNSIRIDFEEKSFQSPGSSLSYTYYADYAIVKADSANGTFSEKAWFNGSEFVEEGVGQVAPEKRQELQSNSQISINDLQPDSNYLIALRLHAKNTGETGAWTTHMFKTKPAMGPRIVNVTPLPPVISGVNDPLYEVNANFDPATATTFYDYLVELSDEVPVSREINQYGARVPTIVYKDKVTGAKETFASSQYNSWVTEDGDMNRACGGYNGLNRKVKDKTKYFCVHLYEKHWLENPASKEISFSFAPNILYLSKENRSKWLGNVASKFTLNWPLPAAE